MLNHSIDFEGFIFSRCHGFNLYTIEFTPGCLLMVQVLDLSCASLHEVTPKAVYRLGTVDKSCIIHSQDV